VDKKNFTMESIIKCAENGDLASQIDLAFIYSKGLPGEGINLKEAIMWDVRAAKQGCAKSQRQVGYAYYYGEGVEPNVKQAEHWWRLAADQNDADAVCALGYITYTGETGESNYLKLAFERIKSSVELGSKNCVSYLAKLLFYGEGTQQNVVIAKQIIDEAYKDGLPNADKVRQEIYGE